MTTKEQERKALERIRKIVAELGENSYVATAFEGCFEIAEENIENDFACSMKQRWESAVADAEEFKRAAEYYSKEADKNAAVLGTVRAELDATKAKILSPDDLSDCEALASDAEYAALQEVTKAAREIVELADDTSNVQFETAVKTHREMRSRREHLLKLIQRIRIVEGLEA